MFYVIEVIRVQLVLLFLVVEVVVVFVFFEVFVVSVLELREYVLFILLLVYGSREGVRGVLDLFFGVKVVAVELERRYFGTRLVWFVVRVEVFFQVRFMDVVFKKYFVDIFFFFIIVWIRFGFEVFNCCCMNVIFGWQVFFLVYFQEFNFVLVLQRFFLGVFGVGFDFLFFFGVDFFWGVFVGGRFD